MAGTPAPSGGFIEWIMQYGQIVAFFAQIAYWLVMLILLGYAVWQYKRWVNYQLGTGRSGKLRAESASAEGDAAEEAAGSPKEEQAVPVEEFVE